MIADVRLLWRIYESDNKLFMSAYCRSALTLAVNPLPADALSSLLAVAKGLSPSGLFFLHSSLTQHTFSFDSLSLLAFPLSHHREPLPSPYPARQRTTSKLSQFLSCGFFPPSPTLLPSSTMDTVFVCAFGVVEGEFRMRGVLGGGGNIP